MEELLKKRIEIIIKLNKASKKLEEEQTDSGFIDKKYIDEVFKWNEELRKIQVEIDR
ncbi:MAG: hypothetical protein KA713_09535 [Chryseotalea sp. WA131a]|nr:MAG: hypothetical protein KA713_09535 [Chryseotalea sp. WA131a]